MLPCGIHGCIFPQIHPVVKSVFSNLKGVSLVSLDLADGTAPALLDVKRIQDADMDAALMQRRCYWLVVVE